MGNHWINLVVLLALIEYFGFGLTVGNARQKYGVKAPATSGNEMFERYFRVQQNTLELLVMFIPALWLAAQHWNPAWMAGIGAVYLVGRIVYFKEYTAEPKRRTMGFALSIVPILVLVLAALAGVLKALFV